jgi:hypothetical protein
MKIMEYYYSKFELYDRACLLQGNNGSPLWEILLRFCFLSPCFLYYGLTQ